MFNLRKGDVEVAVVVVIKFSADIN